MAKKVNTAVIGGFVVCSVTLFIIAILLFSNRTFFKNTREYMLFFEETVSGLSVGAPVKFRGVQIGSVKSMALIADTKKMEISIPILIEIDLAKFRTKDADSTHLEGNLVPLINRGLRAKLDLQSLVTGQYYIQLDFLPGTPINLKATDGDYLQIPTIKSKFTRLSEEFADMPLKETVKNVEEITQLIKVALEKEALAQLIGNLNNTLADVDHFVENLDKESQGLSAELSTSLARALSSLDQVTSDIKSVANHSNSLLDNINDEVHPLSRELQTTFTTAQKSLTSVSHTLATADKFIDDSDVRFKLAKALEEIAVAARSIRSLSGYLERHPESILKGRQK